MNGGLDNMIFLDFSSFGYTILYILLFILCLSVLIAIHELGHLTAAKIFKVYCLEYSIGFGPKLIHVKRKKGETYFSLRAVPFGGYVSMYGEGVELPDGVVIDQSRSLEGIKKWKKSIILLAGVTMNAITALVIFFICNISFEHRYVYAKQISVEEASIAETIGLRSADRIRMFSDTKEELDNKLTNINTQFLKDGYYFIGDYHTDSATFTYQNGTKSKQAAFLNSGALHNYDDISYVDYLKFFEILEYAEDEGHVQYIKKVKTEQTHLDANVKSVTLNFKTIPIKINEKGEKEWDFANLVDHEVEMNVVNKADVGYVLEDIGLKYFVYNEPRKAFGESVGKAFTDFGNASTAIVRALGSLFYSAESWQNVGGIIAIGFESSNVLRNLGVERFLELWGIISVNLAIVNLLPFPGLDGWQLLVTIVEGVSKKKIPDRVKNIVSMIGIGLLLGFMVILIFFDVGKYIL